MLSGQQCQGIQGRSAVDAIRVRIRPAASLFGSVPEIDLAEAHASMLGCGFYVQLERGDGASNTRICSAHRETGHLCGCGQHLHHTGSRFVRRLALVLRSGHQHDGHTLTARDFFDREVLTREVTLDVAANSSRVEHFTQLLAGQLGFYCVSWSPTGPQAPAAADTASALVQPYSHHDSPFGMNHAYPWDFMLRLRRGGPPGWKSRLVRQVAHGRAQAGTMGFLEVDPQIDRVLRWI